MRIVIQEWDTQTARSVAIETADTGVNLNVRTLDINELLKIALARSVVDLQAGADDLVYSELEDASQLDRVGELYGRNLRHYEYDPAEMQQVLASLQAAGLAPIKPLGDLAQTSVSVNGTETQVIGLSEWTIDWKRKTVETTTTDDAEYESSQGSTKSWSAKAKYMFIDADPSQATNILGVTAVTALQADSVLWNFFPTVATGRAAFQGLAIIDGITIASGMGKVVGLDVSLKGTGPLTMLPQIAPVPNANTVTGISGQV